MLGIDPVEENIGTAQLHSSCDPHLGGRVSYRACTLEELSADVAAGETDRGDTVFDAVVASEVVEHLADLETFAFCCSRVLKVCACFQLLPQVRSCFASPRICSAEAHMVTLLRYPLLCLNGITLLCSI